MFILVSYMIFKAHDENNFNSKKKLKIFDYCWHIPHQYDMLNALRDDCEFYFCLDSKKQWVLTQRPLPSNLQFITHYEMGIYDFALLHLDQQITVKFHQKRRIYSEFNDLISDIPKIVINHGTPVFPEFFSEVQPSLSEREMEIKCIEIVKLLVGNNTMVVNSFASASPKEWGFGVPIVHGMNPGEWWDLTKEPRVFSAIALAGFEIYYNKDCLIEVSEILYNTYGYVLAYANFNVETGKSFDDYRNYLGRSLLYLDTSFRTPMNRARTEAFLSGCWSYKLKVPMI